MRKNKKDLIMQAKKIAEKIQRNRENRHSTENLEKAFAAIKEQAAKKDIYLKEYAFFK